MTEGTDRPRIIEYAGNGFVITWEPARCRHAAECVRGLPRVFDNTRRPWIVTDGATVDEVVTVVDPVSELRARLPHRRRAVAIRARGGVRTATAARASAGEGCRSGGGRPG
ncbi:(4Fe-4S)-binding protein [Tsukamurella sp. M9C]|uniref:(4Fe-4S)-binding protein n=1 Tax=Tsukamurella sp. M9C TaxID=2877520 RepID=UPI001CC9A701|nr:(4Fe-4S)-binding protein [Tsukamurella sp. M9C]MCA0158713.1 (4Fe-4S)-binding protein [Tsukamurella sp. M9C]